MLLLFTGKKIAAERRVRIAVSIFFFISGFTFFSWASRIPTIKEHLQLNDAQLGTMLFALPLGLIVTLPFTSMLLGRVSSRYVMLAGALLYVVLLPAVGLANEAWQLAALLFLFGSSRNFLNIAINAQSVGVQAMYNRSIIASFHGIWSLAGFAGAALGSFMISLEVSPFIHFTLIGVLSLIMTILAYGDALQGDAAAKDKKKPLLALPDKPLLKLGLIAFASMACEGTMCDWSGIYFQKEVHVAEKYIGAGYVAYMCTMAMGRFVGDRLVNKHGVKRMIQICGGLITIGLLLSVCLPYFSTAMIGFMLTGFGVSCVVPFIFSVTGKNTTLAAGPAIAAVSVVGYLGFLLGPPMIGYISHEANLRVAFALVAIAGVCIVFLAKKVVGNDSR